MKSYAPSKVTRINKWRSRDLPYKTFVRTSTRSSPYLKPQILMCKRSVERYNNEPKRSKHSEKSYTQGPLDEVFGQHGAFPLDNESDADVSVFQYLESVRKEAENDPVCHFVKRAVTKTSNTREQKFSRTIPGSSALSSEYMLKIMNDLNRAKQKSVESEQNAASTFVLEELDFESDPTSAHEEIPKITEISDQWQANLRDSHETHSSDLASESKMVLSPAVSQECLNSIPQSATAWRQLIFTSPAPSQDYFKNSLEHPTVIKLIVYYTKWLSGSMPEYLHDWIFATFVRLDNALDHQEQAIVRALGTKAQKLRRKFLEGAADGAQVSEVAQSCVDMVLAVVSQYYGQKDLLFEED